MVCGQRLRSTRVIAHSNQNNITNPVFTSVCVYVTKRVPECCSETFIARGEERILGPSKSELFLESLTELHLVVGRQGSLPQTIPYLLAAG